MGFIAHMKGCLTKKIFRYATVFIYHLSDLKYVQCMSEITSEETIYTEIFFERNIAVLNVRV